MSDKSSKPSNSQERPNIWPTMLWVLLLAITLPWLLRMFSGQNQAANLVSYSDFRSQLREGNVSQVTIQGERVEGELIQPVQLPVVDGETAEIARFVTYVPQFGDPALLEELQVSNVEIVIRSADTFEWTTFFLTLLPFVLMIGLAIMLFRGMRSQTQNIFPIVKSGARQYDQNKSVKTTFDDVAGAEGAKRELQEIVEYLKRPDSFKRLGGQIPKGVLLVGPPGTGKTLLARAVAGEAGVPFLSITGSDFMEMFVGVGASRVRDLFSEAKKISPSIIFIDELDSVGRKRGTGLGGGHDEREQTLNQMLSEMDGFEPNENVIVMAATNRPDILDPALQRPGRFDRQVTVDLPTRKDRLEILQIHTRNKPLENDVDLDRIARGTPLFSGADLENLLNEAALLAARGGKNKIENEDVEEARDKVLMGLKRENLVLTGEEYRLLAYHEAGHAVLACMLPNADPLHKVTIVPRGRAMGVTQQLPERDRYLYPRDYITDRMAVMMGGRAAEVLVFSNITSGAEDDLKQATRMARKMVLDWGMSSRLGHIALGDHREHVFLGEEIAQGREYSETTAREVDEEVRSILKEAFDKALSVLQEQRHGMDRLVDALLEKEEVSGQEVMGIIHDLADQEAERPNDSQRIEQAGLPRLSPSAG